MTTYKTIKEAFRNGSGDVFFTKHGEFLAVSRKDNHTSLINSGYSVLTYGEVVSLSLAQSPTIEHKKDTPFTKNEITRTVRSISSTNHYYDEFPDAYGQNL